MLSTSTTPVVPEGDIFMFERRTRHAAMVGALALLTLAGVVAPASAAPQARKERVTICHLDDAGEWSALTLAAPGAAARLRAGDAEIGDPYPGSDGLVFSSDCRAVFTHADASVAFIESIRADYEPPCETSDGAVECGPGEGGELPPIEWDQTMADRAEVLAAECPVFTPRNAGEINIYLHWSPQPVTNDELAQLAVENWAEKIVQYDVLTGTGIRNGDTSTDSYKRLLTVKTFGIGVRSDCPNNRGVVVMVLDSAPPEGPVYGVTAHEESARSTR